MTREGKLQYGDLTIHISNALLDTGASDGNYAGSAVADRFDDIEREPCNHRVRLGDGKTMVQCTEMITLDVSLYAPDGSLQAPISTVFYIMPSLGDRIIIGLPDILGNSYDYFTTILEDARNRRPKQRVERLSQLYGLCKDQLCSATPNQKLLKNYGHEAKAIGSWYTKLKHRVLHDPKVVMTLTTNSEGINRETAHSAKFGTVLVGNSIEDLCTIIEDLKDFPIGEILDAWENPQEFCPEEEETPDPLAMGPDILGFMETPIDVARQEYLDLIETQVTPEMRKDQPRVYDILTSPAALETFSPSSWDGLKIPPVSFDIIGNMPTSMVTKARSIREDLYHHAKKEFDRLVQYLKL